MIVAMTQPDQPRPWDSTQPTGYTPAESVTASTSGMSSAAPTLPSPTATRSRRGVATLAAVAVLSAGVGGGSAVVFDHYVLARPGTTTTVTRVVQGDSSAPDWSVTAAAVSPSVVSITVRSSSGGDEGSGVVLDASGHIVTNNHVVTGAGTPDSITVSIGERTYTASVVGTDATTDLAVIALNDPPSTLTPIAVADMKTLAVGQPVMAVGNALGLSDTVTTGIISALNRPVVTQEAGSNAADAAGGVVVTNAIQTSAPINPGNSGGALVNAAGELVGINSSIASVGQQTTSAQQAGNIGIGFAIPASQVTYIADQLIKNGHADHAYLGLSTSDTTVAEQKTLVLGAKVERVVAGSAAADAGLRSGDVIVALGDAPVTSSESLVGLVRASAIGQRVTLTIIRDGQRSTVQATLGTAPATSR